MKKLFLLVSLAAVSLGFSSCCSMFSMGSSHSHTETRQVKSGYDIIVTEVHTPGDAKSGIAGTTETSEKKVPRYKTVTKTVRDHCNSCVRLYCPKKDCCGTTSETTLKMASLQGGSGSPHMGLVPSMKPLAP